MKQQQDRQFEQDSLPESGVPGWWRIAVISLSVLILCSCRSPARGPHPAAQPLRTPGSDTLPESAWTGASDVEAGCLDCQPSEVGPPQQWAPPGISRPWPKDEYICDGGDRGVEARVQADWQIRGLHTEDTIAHFDTIDGETIVEPSNQVCIYAPRFGAVRKVVGVSAYDIKEGLVLHTIPTKVGVEEEVLVPGAATQHQQPEAQINAKKARAQQLNGPSLLVGGAVGLIEAANVFAPHENFRLLRDGIVERADEPMLATHVQAAMTWTHDKGVQLIVGGQFAAVETGDVRAQATYAIGRKGTSKLRIVKVASTEAANPGELVDFTLRFDNVGTEPLGNVTIVDNLTTRLEYLQGSQKCSLDSDFLTQANDGGSLVLRWEIIDPLPPGEGGIIRFKCRVR